MGYVGRIGLAENGEEDFQIFGVLHCGQEERACLLNALGVVSLHRRERGEDGLFVHLNGHSWEQLVVDGAGSEKCGIGGVC